MGLFFSLFRKASRAGRRAARTGPASRVPEAVRERTGDDAAPPPEILRGRCHVIDGDTIVIGGTPVRLAGIDAPEFDQPYGRKAKFAMIALCKGRIVTAETMGERSYGRVVATCHLPDGTDLSAALVEQGLALDWKTFSGGAYRPLEPEGVRKKLWRVAAKHRGQFGPSGA